MITELGHFALVLALMVALLQASLPLWGAARGNPSLMAFADPAALLQLAAIALAFFALMRAYVVSDFTLLNVVENSHSAKPLLYKVTGVWGNHEGSMLLWVLILALFGAAVAVFGRTLPSTLKARVLAVQAMIAVGFLSFSLFTSNPFARVFPPPGDGQGLNPLLQDPGLAFHPPMLYLGYVGFSMAFSFAVAALIEGRVDAAWARWVRPWTLLAWCFLTGGIALGSWWAYYELGWGGWWFWDPVENVSLMPWLLGTALLHSALVVEKRDALKVWTILLAILTFSLSLIGTFVVRSGIITSVHAFASDPARGLFILLLLGLAVGGSLVLFAWRAPALKPGGIFSPISREGALVLNNLLLATAAATVFLGTLYPLFLEAVGGARVSVGPPYYEATFVPLMVPLVLVMGVGPLLGWKRADLAGVLGRLKLAAAAALLAALLASRLGSEGPLLAPVGLGLAAWLLLASVTEWCERIALFRQPLGDSLRRARRLPRAAHGTALAHAGFALVIAGVVASTAWKEEVVTLLAPGESVALAGYDWTLESVGERPGPNYRASVASLLLSRRGEEVARLYPEKRLYPLQNRTTTEAAIRSRLLGDLYATLGEPAADGRWAVRLYREPLVPWIWGGALVMMLGGALSLSDRRLRIGAPARRAPGAAKPLPAE